jgi:hypothetical protein
MVVGMAAWAEGVYSNSPPSTKAGRMIAIYLKRTILKIDSVERFTFLFSSVLGSLLIFVLAIARAIFSSQA